MRRTVVTALRKLGAIAVENSAYPGTPDVAYRDGWIELKHVAKWPKNPTRPLRIRHLTQQQRAWWLRWTMYGGRVHVLLQVGRKEWLLLDPTWAYENLGKTSQPDIRFNAIADWRDGLDVAELIAILGRPR